MHATLIDMNGTLERIMESLADLEGEARPAAGAGFSSASELPAETSPLWEPTAAPAVGPEPGEEENLAKEAGEIKPKSAPLKPRRSKPLATPPSAPRNARGGTRAPAHAAPSDEPLEPGSGGPVHKPADLPNRAMDELHSRFLRRPARANERERRAERQRDERTSVDRRGKASGR